ncbi:MAG: hypothetical protein NVSMB1_09120 [Polyangiales bacterium]
MRSNQALSQVLIQAWEARARSNGALFRIVGGPAAALLSSFCLPLILTVAACGCGGAPKASIGIVAQQEPTTGRIIVMEVPDGLAGARAGLEVGDEVVAVDGNPVSEMTRGEFRQVVRGDVGTHVILTIRRDGILRKVDVERDALK